ncbi:MAG: hypothetical protein WD024_00650 [Bacillota bacterium]
MHTVLATNSSGATVPPAALARLSVSRTHAAYLAAIVYLALAPASYLCYPGTYSPLRNWLSDLGNSLTNTKRAVFYNAGCTMASLLLIVFYLSMSVWRTGDKVLGRLLAVAQISGVFSSLALILSAVINIGRNYVVLLAVNARLLEEAESSTPAQAGAPK